MRDLGRPRCRHGLSLGWPGRGRLRHALGRLRYRNAHRLGLVIPETRHDREWQPLSHPRLPHEGAGLDDLETEEIVELLERELLYLLRYSDVPEIVVSHGGYTLAVGRRAVQTDFLPVRAARVRAEVLFVDPSRG